MSPATFFCRRYHADLAVRACLTCKVEDCAQRQVATPEKLPEPVDAPTPKQRPLKRLCSCGCGKPVHGPAGKRYRCRVRDGDVVPGATFGRGARGAVHRRAHGA